MRKIKIGILGTSDIAFRRFLPALQKSDHFEYVGIASRNYAKTEKFIEKYGGRGYENYETLLDDSKVEAIYLPLPPALHYEWAIKALDRGKHILLEKPFTTKLEHTKEVLRLADEKNLTVHENYMFIYHSQLKRIKEIINGGSLGQVRLYRMAFGFPKRAANDFRYNREFGGGALLDCGGYPVRLAADLLGNTATVTASRLNYVPEFDVDLSGSATLENTDGLIAQVSFGMDNFYKCELEVWGSKGTLVATRIFTAGPEFEPEAVIMNNNEQKNLKFPSDDQFLNSIDEYYGCIQSDEIRTKMYQKIMEQSLLVEKIIRRDRFHV
jgi:NDP-hexose-3-ketoreductase